MSRIGRSALILPRVGGLPLPHRFSPLLLVAIALITGQAALAATLVDVRILDWNIERSIGGSDSTIGAQPEIAKVVNYLNPDIWTINELGGNSSGYNALNAHGFLSTFVQTKLTIFGANPVEGVHYFLYVGTMSDGFISNAIVSRYPLIETQSYSDAGGGFASLRGLQMALVDVPGETDIGVFTAHLKAQSANNDALRRQAEANADKNTINTWISAHASAAVVVAGDFNETEDAEDSPNWSNHEIGDPLPGTGEPYRPISTLRSLGLRDAKPVSIRGDNDTISSTNPNARFDYILYSGDKLNLTNSMIFDTGQYTTGQLAALNSANGTNFVSADSAGASDHLPVFAVLTIPEPGGILLIVVAYGCWYGQRRPRCRRSS
jgi:endonuclease/exonuclease/phosphatase family metal-dependent hydrolase